MNRKLIAVMPEMTAKEEEAIRSAAEQYGIEASFYPTAEAAMPHVEDAEILFGFSPELASKAPNLKWYCTSSAGVDRFTDRSIYAAENVILTSSSGAYGTTIAEHAVMVILEVLRRQGEYTELVSSHIWKRGLPVRSIYRSRITLLGTGDIGKSCAERLKGFRPACMIGVNHSGNNPQNCFDRAVPVSQLEEVLPETDILILSLPKTDETYHLLKEQQLSLLPEGALVVNVGRGTVIDQKALEQELRKGRLYAALDVFEEEPLGPEASIWDCPNLLITPHCSGDLSLASTVEETVRLFLENLKCYAEGKPLKRIIDFDKGY
ncbi:MAG: D-2-hydroxyacid dehydrogenase [Solobacterium sp.]|nr:D-2-hydroxyacid dehydrogenase [Solobacterium sp.]